MRPDDFWALSTQEFWWEFDYKYRQQKAIKEKAGPARGKFSEAEWQEARRRHKEKMNGRNSAT